MDRDAEVNLERAAILHGAKLGIDAVLELVRERLFPPDIREGAERNLREIRYLAETNVSEKECKIM